MKRIQEEYDWTKHTNPEKGDPKSNTIPDQNYTIQEIMERFTRGQTINGMVSYNEFDGEYENTSDDKPDFDGFMPHPKTLDLVDRQHLAQEARLQLGKLEQKKKNFDEEQIRLSKKDKETINELTKKIQILENPAGGTDKKE